jgi:small subunit ribosomal protein S5
VGQSPGKGGGGRRIIVKKTARMHKSGRRLKMRAMAIVGNRDGLIGIGEGKGKDAEVAINKAVKNAKLNIIKVQRGCGSWECLCNEEHSIPIKTFGKCSSVSVELIPAPKGLGLCANDELKKLLRLAGLKDIWMKSRGNTGARDNLVKAVFLALKNIKRFNF